MASAEHEPITGTYGRSPQLGPEAQPLILKAFFAFERQIELVSWSSTSLSAQIWLYQRRTVTVYRGHRRALCFLARDYLPGHHVHGII